MDLPFDSPEIRLAFTWATVHKPPPLSASDYCATRDVLDARINRLLHGLLKQHIPENTAYLLHALVSEIGGNSFDHNLGQWPDVPGAFLRDIRGTHTSMVILADRGQGIRTTLTKVKPTIASDEEALKAAFLEHISSRAPERRGNGLKFVRREVLQDGMDIFFQSGTATYAVCRKHEKWETSETDVTGCFAVLSCPSP